MQIRTIVASIALLIVTAGCGTKIEGPTAPNLPATLTDGSSSVGPEATAGTSVQSTASLSALTLSVSPTAGTQTTLFTVNGTGYTPNGVIYRHVRIPGQAWQQISSITATASGTITTQWPFVPGCSYPIGTAYSYAVDGATGRQSPTISEQISAASTCTATWWAGLTQTQRGDQIYAAARSYLNAVNGNCKEFARTVVLQASRQLVAIPSNVTDYQWAMPNTYVFPVAGLSNAIHGDVIQMRVYDSIKKTWGPHTTIIVSISGDTLTVIDANWVRNASGQGIVAQHSWSIGSFLMNTSKVSNWTLYRIGGGR